MSGLANAAVFSYDIISARLGWQAQTLFGRMPLILPFFPSTKDLGAFGSTPRAISKLLCVVT